MPRASREIRCDHLETVALSVLSLAFAAEAVKRATASRRPSTNARRPRIATGTATCGAGRKGDA
jgi:hypothetical protein